MALNPLRFASAVNTQYLRYQLTASRLTDPSLAKQLRDLVWPAIRRESPLLKGPYVSLSRAFKEGRSVQELVQDGVLHPQMERVATYSTLYQHQEKALHAAKAGSDLLVTTGTGSGKTEAFLYPIIDRCLQLNDDPDARKGVVAIILYPMNALANDQQKRLRDMLAGTGVTFAMYTGDTKEDVGELPYQPKRVPAGGGREAYLKLVEQNADQEGVVVIPAEERLDRPEIRKNPPQILLVNSAILELNLTRGEDLDLFLGAPLEFLVLDEAHTNTGAKGAEVALLLRRLKALAKPPEGRITHIATSATIADPKNSGEGQRFVSRLFGTDEKNVAVIREEYQEVDWATKPIRTKLPNDAEALLEEALSALEIPPKPEREGAIRKVVRSLTHLELDEEGTLEERLYRVLQRTDYAHALYKQGDQVKPLDKLVTDTWDLLGRTMPGPASRAELLTYLALGAAAERDGAPLLRPKIHYFVKGLDGAGVVFRPHAETGKIGPRLYLSCEEARTEWEDHIESTAVFPVVSCPQCGQHHYTAHYQAVLSQPAEPLQGGMVGEQGQFFFPDKTETEKLVLFTDSLIQDQADGSDDSAKIPKAYREAQVCTGCGALHMDAAKKCQACTRNNSLHPVYVINSTDRVKSCPICRYSQGFAAKRYKHPFRALREIAVANVHILAQDMLNQVDERGRRLIVFADNRQDAAFQAGWMRDRARRFRFRQLLFEQLVDEDAFGKTSPLPDVSLGNVLTKLKKTLTETPGMAQLLAPEVFQDEVVEAFSPKIQKELDRFLAVQLLREIASPFNTRASLEAWGRLRVHYAGLSVDHPSLQALAARFSLSTDTTLSWIESLLDITRRQQIVFDERADIFSRTWDQRYDLVQNRYLPGIDFHPTGLRLEHEPNAVKADTVRVWISKNTTAQDWLRTLNLTKEEGEVFLRAVWTLLTDDLKILRRLPSLLYGNGKPIKGTANVYQIDAHKMGITKQDQRFECELCGRIHGREPPLSACTRYRCKGNVVIKPDQEPEDYDRTFLKTATTMVMAEEHTAQVPPDQRTRIEMAFKDGNRAVNTLVATPTLELGVDIGALDMVLLRNVPPLPANYWQRAGRAGRRNRMAVVYTYARSHPHDAAFFKNPIALLDGPIRPPRFNLRNGVMIRKHVHAAVLTHLHAGLKGKDDNWLNVVIPKVVGQVLFDGGKPRDTIAPVVKPLRDALALPGELERLTDLVEATFTKHWPDEARAEVDRERLMQFIREMPDELQLTYGRLLDRLQWAMSQIQRLADRLKDGSLDDEDNRFLERCRRTVNALKPYQGDDDEARKAQLQNYTLSVLAREGFLPGHTTGRGSVVATADRAYSPIWKRFQFDLPRPSAIAIREHVPGNLIYANGGKYKLSHYKFPASQQTQSPPEFHVDTESGAVRPVTELGSTFHVPSGTAIKSLPLVDSALQFVSHVDDAEAHRFRMPSVVSGVLRKRHNGGTAFRSGDHEIHHLRNQRLVLVNLGVVKPAADEDASAGSEKAGYPLCRVCGGVRSPRETDEGVARFEETHTKKCGVKPERYAIHTETDVDGLLFYGLTSQADVVNLGESLSLAASHVLEMNRHDLMWVDVPKADKTWDLFLYDPMPGGSGLLQQILERWNEIVDAGETMLKGCPNGCPTSCHDCLRTYYNQLHHDKLDRNTALELVKDFQAPPEPINEIAQVDEISGPSSNGQTNLGEKELEAMFASWGLGDFTPQGDPIPLPLNKSHTTPDLRHTKAKIAIYLDGPHHDDAKTKLRDQALRAELRDGLGWAIFIIDPKDLGNPKIMQGHRAEISMALLERLSNG